MQAWHVRFPPPHRCDKMGRTNLFNLGYDDLSGSVHSTVISEPRHIVCFLCGTIRTFARSYSALIILRLAGSLCDGRNSSCSANTILSLPLCWGLWWWHRGFRVDHNDFRGSSIFIEIWFFMCDPICSCCPIRRPQRFYSVATDPVNTICCSMRCVSLRMPGVMHVGTNRYWRWRVIILVCGSWSGQGLSHCA